MITARYASLVAFAQSRAFCPTGIGNGTDNSCSSAAPGVSSYDDLPKDMLDSHGVVYDPGKSPFTSLKRAESVSIMSPRRTMEVAKEVGIKNPSDIAVIGAATSPGASVDIESSEYMGVSRIKIRARSPIDPNDKSAGTAKTLVSVTPDKVVHYDFFDLSSDADKAVQSGKVSLSVVSASILSLMAKSLEAAERNGMKTAKADSVGGGTGTLSYGAAGQLQGYRLWPKFGFDGEVDAATSKRFFVEMGQKHLTSQSAARYQTSGKLNVQDIVATKKGEEWWNRNGKDVSLRLNFGDKSSDGYKRYKQMLEVGKKAAARLAKSGRSEVEFWEWVSTRSGIPSLGEFEQRAFCPTGEGGGVKNDCSSSDGGGGDQKPQSFPKGSQPLRDAVDSVAPAPDQIWDRSKGLAETPPPKQIDDIAAEQGSHSGALLTPEAEASYKSLVDEIGRQYEALTAAGLKAKAWRGEGEPYGDPPGSTKPNSNKMRDEVAKAGEFSFFMTDKGFGTGDATPDHPMLRETKYKTADGEPMIANDLFRVVHDMVAHVRGGYSFSTNGEYNGMLTHASTLPEAAWPALFAETFGQNAVYEKTKQYAPQNAYASKIGPEIIRSELKKRTKSSRNAKDDGDEPLGYQHLKARPWLMKDAAESRSADCGRDDDGKFASNNKCGGLVDMPKEDPRGRLRYDNGVQTDAARKLYQMGSSEKKLKALVDVMGGDAKTTRVDINPPSVNISVSDKDGNKLYHVDFENGRARVYPSKDLSSGEAAKIEDAAAEAFGSTQADTKITVYRKAEDMKKWESENAAKIKKWEDKYKFSTLLPPHQRPKKWERSIDARYASLLAFAEARDCGQDPDGKFSKGNTCASGMAADAAKGAAKGAAVGAASGFAKTFLPQAAATGAAVGAVAGAVKGIYDNKMRPTRVSDRMKSLGLKDEDVANIVTSLKGTPKSVATTTGSSRLTVRVKDKDGKTSHVIDFTKKTVTIYPRSGRKELSDKELDSIKQIAKENSTKQTRFAVKTDSLSYAKRIARNGFEVAANKAGLLVATAVVSGAAPSVPDFVLGMTDLVFDTHFTDSFYRKPDAKRR